ncbi:hypothetical protein [Streptomyces sp. NPDC095817]|uniref:hypothetical protein n=1 Tax=Streptomyces sp. NPDC095817 TaxID=3155082 RepID=UPI003324E9D5
MRSYVDAHTYEWTHPPYEDQEPAHVFNSPLFTAARKAVEFLGDQFGAAAGPGGRTAHLRTQGVVFTLGICEAGDVYLRNEDIGDVIHLPHINANSSPNDIAEAVFNHIGDIY